MELEDAAYLDLTETQIRETIWFKHPRATYDQIFPEDKPGIHEHDQQWILDDENAEDDGPMVVEAFQGCLFEDGSEVPGRYHGVPDTSQTMFLGFNAIYENCHRWFCPWTSERARFRFIEVLRQYADVCGCREFGSHKS